MSRKSLFLRMFAVTAAAVAVAAVGLTSPASAHGAVINPAYRAYSCWQRWGNDHLNPNMAYQDPMCYQAWQANPNAMWNWNGLYRNGVGGNHQAAVPNGTLCSGGHAEGGRYNALDAVGNWHATQISTNFTMTIFDQASHGADYFRRWHRDKANSGGLMVHKATHHFDLVNWWIDGTPVEVYARGRLFFYGPEGQRHGYARQYARATAAPDAAGDPFALDLASHPRLRALYLDAEHEDGYHRDQNVFGPGVTIEDDMSVLVTYASGATMTYHLTAYSPWEGYRLMVNGSKGRLELEVVENDYVSPTTAATVKGEAGSAALHGDTAPPEDGSVRLTVHPFWEKPRQIQVPHERTGHGGADARMTAAIFGPSTGPDPLGRSATERDGAASLLVGLAANESFRTGAPVKVADLLAPYTLTDLVPGHSTR